MSSVGEKLGPFVRLSDFAAKRNLDQAQMRVMIRAGEVLAVPVGNGNAALPGFQFTNGGEVVPWLSEVFGRFDRSRKDNVQFALWLREPAEELKGKAPIDLLKSGLFSPVLQFASKVGEQRSKQSK